MPFLDSQRHYSAIIKIVCINRVHFKFSLAGHGMVGETPTMATALAGVSTTQQKFEMHPINH